MLYRATKDPHYVEVGRQMMCDLEANTRAKCGYTTLHDVKTKSKEDRMESFFLSETLKYLYLLFDPENVLHTRAAEDHVFTTQAHVIRLSNAYRDPPPPPPSPRRRTRKKKKRGKQRKTVTNLINGAKLMSGVNIASSASTVSGPGGSVGADGMNDASVSPAKLYGCVPPKLQLGEVPFLVKAGEQHVTPVGMT
jgi:hypothetical protein